MQSTTSYTIEVWRAGSFERHELEPSGCELEFAKAWFASDPSITAMDLVDETAGCFWHVDEL